MSGYTTEHIRNIFNNHAGESMIFKDPFTQSNLHIYPLEDSFFVKTIKDGEVRRTGRIMWSVYLQAFVGNDYHIPISWRI